MKKYSLGHQLLVAILIVAGSWVPGSVGAASVNNWGLENITYTSRADWGATESWRLTSRSEYQKILAAAKQFEGTEEEPTEAEIRKQTATDYILKLFAGDFKIDKIIRGKGANALRWPNQYKIKKTKILVHHTADNNKSLPSTVAEEKEYMKNLYRYHAFSRGRGDIGYNFIIMPSGRIYEGRAGGAGVVGAHATWNNVPSVGVSLVGNFEEKQPEQAQIHALTNILTSISKRYDINPTEETYFFHSITTFPYIKAEKHSSIAGHRDAGQTACPGENLYALLGDIRLAVADRLAGGSSTVATSSIVVDSSDVAAVKNAYITANGALPTKAASKKIEGAPKSADISTIVKKPIPVLLYDASASLEEWSLSCSSACSVRINSTKRTASALKVQKKGKQFAVTIGTKTFTASKFAVTSNGLISITNYNRASGAVKLNTFKQALLFAYGPVKQINKEAADQHHVINIVSLDNYMKGIGEASDSQSQTKANVLALLAKGYTLFYVGGSVRHQSIPAGALYVITDDPRISQKYSGAGRENLSKKRATALSQTQGQYIVYNGVLPILPYFHCSAGFTWSGKENRGRSDTPYLQSVVDAKGACDSGDFEGHGVGLSGNGASAMADEGKSVSDIIQYYYPGVTIIQK